MDTLLNPDIGLVIWTIASFLILVALLRVLAWKPLLGAVEAREARMREEREKAELARREAERIQNELNSKLTRIEEDSKKTLAEAVQKGESLRAQIKKDAEAEAKNIMDKTRLQLDEEKRRLVGELRSEVASLSVLAAERLLHKSVDSGVQKTVMDRFFADLEKEGKKN